MIEKQLAKAFPQPVRDEFTSSLIHAYQLAREQSLTMGSFADRALGYLKHFWSDALLESTAKRLGLSHSIGLNKAKNTPHLLIQSGNWQLSPHHLSGSGAGKLPSRALYREHYSRMNDLFGGDGSGSSLLGGYVYLLHDGKFGLENVSLAVPALDHSTVVHSEFLPLVDVPEFAVEEIPDSVTTRIQLKVEDQLRNNSNKG